MLGNPDEVPSQLFDKCAKLAAHFSSQSLGGDNMTYRED